MARKSMETMLIIAHSMKDSDIVQMLGRLAERAHDENGEPSADAHVLFGHLMHECANRVEDSETMKTVYDGLCELAKMEAEERGWNSSTEK